ncbi:MAG TPA: magnesium transporter CorA family protein [Solirubrobacteraceae bacterium]|jgi:magnesium transporter|nr:magnesium transporter CorA family protein [Solirubrobacteraceae bacterium]
MSAGDPTLPLLGASHLEQVPELLSARRFFWLDLHDPTPDQLGRLGELLHLHPLTIEDVSTFSERPKREHYEGYISLVVYGVDPAEAAGGELLREVHLLISGDWVVTLHPTPFGVLDHLRARVQRDPSPRERSLIFQILDAVLSSYVPVLDRVDDAIDQIEEDVIAQPREESLQRIFSLKRDLIGMRRVVSPMRDFFAHDADEITHLPGMEPDDSLYFRDLYDNVVRTSELIDSYRDLLSGATDMYLSTVANRQGEISKQLTIIATIFLPLSFLTGFFGQNFAWLTGNVLNTTWSFFVLGLGLLLAAVVGFWFLFRRKGWLNPSQ